jgi:2-polyprenyl-3-methyl-5-hydroxy-6-metoxy-1,4-benzoquinol methylase
VSETETAFNAEQFANPYPDGIQHHYWTLARNAMVLKALRRTLGAMPTPDDLVMDVGCGRGITVEYLRRHGVHAIGADTGTPQPIVPEVAPFLHPGQDAAQLPAQLRQSVRAMLLLDVLELVPEPAAFVATLANAYPGCSHIVVTVPARQELWSNYDRYYGHFRRYDRASARLLYPAEMFDVTNTCYAFRLLYAPTLLLAKLNLGRSVSIAAPTPRARAMHRLLAGYFAVESALLPRWVLGTSLLLTLRRRSKHTP